MKKLLAFSACSALLLGAAFIYACQKEKVALPSSVNTKESPVALERSGNCASILVARGVGLVICGSDSGTTGCTACGQNHFSQPVTNISQTFGITGSNVFSLYNPTGSTIRAGLSFNCANQAPLWVNIAAGATVSYSVVEVNGCCTATPCY